MNEFINEFGKENFIIIIAVVIAIILALIIIVVIEKLQAKANLKKQFKSQLNRINDMQEQKINVNQTPVVENNETENFIKEDTNVEQINNDIKDNQTQVNNYQNEVYYVEEDSSKAAKEKLEEVTKKLIDSNDDLIDHTHFETEQEEKSIISYEELVNASSDIDEKNDKLLEDETEAAITLEELYKKYTDEQDEEEEKQVTESIKVNNPIFAEEEPKKFKNSEVISPVFGFYNGEIKNDKPKTKDYLEDMNKLVETEELESEIQRTEEFLTELKSLKDKLD